MFKRIFLLVLAAVAGWIVWTWLRQRAHDFDTTIPQLAPLESIARTAPAPPAPTPQPMPPTPAPIATASSDLVEAVAEALEAPAGREEVSQGTPAMLERTADERSSAEAVTSTEHAGAAAEQDSAHLDAIIGYCVRCKTKRPIAGAHEETTESGRRAARGTCPVCGANMFTFLKEGAAEE